MQKRLKHYVLAAMLLLAPMAASAQVTIGSGDKPADFSVLELISNDKLGMRLPQIETTDLRNAILSETEKKDPLSQGLQIFNKETRCVETWNGTKWIAVCAPINCGTFRTTEYFCGGSTIADLSKKAGAAVAWYVAATGGEALAANTPLENRTYYAGNCSDQSARRSVTVELVTGDCTNPVIADNIRVTTFTNVMYDFQHQTLEAYVTGGGVATDYQWQVSKDNVTYSDIPGATARTWKIPENLIHNPSLLDWSDYTGIVENSDRVDENDNHYYTADGELWFKVKMKNPKNTDWEEALVSNALPIAFIKTTDGGQGNDYLDGYGELNGVKYLNLTTERFALLNLGQSGTGSFNMNVPQQLEDAANLNDAGDLGDYYQWGRIADGHEKIVWGKDPDTKANTLADGTSLTISKGNLVSGVDYNPYGTPPNANQAGQVIHPDYVGKFIHTAGITEWGEGNNPSDARWGNQNVDTDKLLIDWSFPNNNVCPEGWRVPSRRDFADIYRGLASNMTEDGTTTTPYVSTADNVNDWYWRASTSHAVGGVIIRNLDGKKLFLPEIDQRATNGLYGGGELCFYSTTAVSRNWVGTVMRLTATSVTFNMVNAQNRSIGNPVRCVVD